MVGRIRLAGLIATSLVIFLPSFALAQDINFGVSPSKIRIDNLPPGESTEFDLAIHNQDEVTRVFSLSSSEPPEERRSQGRTEFPDDSWISFSRQQLTLDAGCRANVTVTVAIPPEQEWAGKKWETWLGVTAESTDVLGAKLYVRLLVSTKPAVGGKSNIGLIAGIAAAIVLLSYGSYYYLRRRAKAR